MLAQDFNCVSVLSMSGCVAGCAMMGVAVRSKSGGTSRSKSLGEAGGACSSCWLAAWRGSVVAEFVCGVRRCPTTLIARYLYLGLPQIGQQLLDVGQVRVGSRAGTTKIQRCILIAGHIGADTKRRGLDVITAPICNG